MSSASWAMAASDSQRSRAAEPPAGGLPVKPMPVSTSRTAAGSGAGSEPAAAPRAAPRNSTSAWRTTGRS
jgi:hypothetical protein